MNKDKRKDTTQNGKNSREKNKNRLKFYCDKFIKTFKKKETSGQTKKNDVARSKDNCKKGDESKTQLTVAKKNDLKEKLSRRAVLEQEMVMLISGKTGMMYLWSALIYAAEQGKGADFLFCASSYSDRANRLKEVLENLSEIANYSKTVRIPLEDDLVRLLTAPVNYEKECRQLICNNDLLCESGLTDRVEIESEELSEWLMKISESIRDMENHPRDT